MFIYLSELSFFFLISMRVETYLGMCDPILKKINLSRNTGSLEGLMLKLKFQHFGHLMQRTESSKKNPDGWKRLKVEGEGDDRG